jgi:hypothetical protein
MESMETVDQGGLLAALGAVMFIYFALFLLITISLWKIFSKAGRPGWAAIVPIYNLIVWLDIVGKPTWWIILLLLPIVNLVILIMIIHQMSVVFGQGIGTTLLLIFLPFIGYPMLAFGSAQYTGKVPAAQPI